MAEYGVIIRNERMVVDNNIITSTGPSTAVDVAFDDKWLPKQGYKITERSY